MTVPGIRRTLGVITPIPYEDGRPLMTAGYDGQQIVGMDLHRKRSVLVRMSSEGERLGKARIVNSPAALRTEIAKAGPLSAKLV